MVVVIVGLHNILLHINLEAITCFFKEVKGSVSLIDPRKLRAFQLKMVLAF